VASCLPGVTFLERPPEELGGGSLAVGRCLRAASPVVEFPVVVSAACPVEESRAVEFRAVEFRVVEWRVVLDLAG